MTDLPFHINNNVAFTLMEIGWFCAIGKLETRFGWLAVKGKSCVEGYFLHARLASFADAGPSTTRLARGPSSKTTLTWNYFDMEPP